MPRPIQTSGTKVCTTCRVEKNIDEFYFRGGKYSPNSRKSKCKECDKKRLAENHDPIKYREQHLKRTYGITQKDYEVMLSEQDNQCAICKTTEPGGRHTTDYFVVDHCHTTGKVRKLLCHNCNTALGLVGDNICTLQKMIQYLSTNTH